MVFKCKMCGGDIAPIENTNTGKCLYCKSVMTLPNLDNEKIVNLYNRANDLRLENEFDKAYGVYETILEIDNQQIEARWGLILCKYGVEYVDDVKTKKKIPTCHRTIEQIITNDVDYKYIIKNAYGDALELYKKEAEEIKEIQKRIKEVSGKEKPYDVFICYKETDDKGERTHDSLIAEDIYEALTKEGYKVFFARITLEDKLGTEYEPYIYSALTSAKVMLVVGTAEDNFNSVWVKNEWSRYLEFMRKDKNKVMIPVYSKLDAYKLPEEFVNLQAQSMDKIGAMQDLVRGVKKILTTPDKQNNLDAELEKRLNETSDGVKNLGQGKYEVTKLKVKYPVWFYFITIGLIGVSVFISGLFFFEQDFSFAKLFSYYSSYLHKSFITVILFIISILTLSGGLLKMHNSKIAHRISEILIGLSIFNCFVLAMSALNNLAFISIFWLVMTIPLILLYFINPNVYIDSSSKLIVNDEEKKEILTKNDKIRLNFTRKRASFVFNLVMLIIIVLFAGIYIMKLHSIYNTSYANGRKEDVNQIKILKDTCILENNDRESRCLSPVFQDEYYTVLDIRCGGNNYTDYNNYIIYKVKNSKGDLGYIWSDNNFDEYKYVQFIKGNKQADESLNLTKCQENDIM